jgi:diguanylate cyclase (GGDEF)-like protein
LEWLVYNDTKTGEQEKDLFVRIFRQLGDYKDPYQSISGILMDTCEFFGFYCGFVYEADHTQVFRLCERYLCPDASLEEQFVLSDYLKPREIEELVKKTGEIVYLNSKKSKLGAKFLELFSAQTLVMIPVIFEGKTPAAFVGMMDRRHPIRLTKREIDDADAVLSVLAGHIKMRVYQKQLENVHSTMKNMVNKAGVDIYVSDFSTHEILFANESMAVPYGGIDKLIGRRCWEVLFPNQTGQCTFCSRDKLIDQDGNPTKMFSWDFQRPFDGSWVRMVNAAFRWVDGRLAHVVSSVDITENKYNEMLIRRLAESDSLTSLPNRGKLLEDLELSLKRMKKDAAHGYLLFIDLDDFKKINDTFGHLDGDALLRQVGHFLHNEKAVLGMPYRYGGDEFVIISEYKTLDQLAHIHDILLEKFSREWQLNGHSVYCGISIGAARIPDRNKSAVELIHAADMAMYEVKRRGKHGFRLSGRQGSPRKTNSTKGEKSVIL